MTNKAIAYMRASTDMQDASIPEQKKSIDEFAKKNDLYVIRYFEDEGRSGRNAEERPAFMEMKGFVENSNNFRFILVYDCTRFGRFKDPQEAPTPGQAVVFYDKDTVVGGGWIKEVV